MKFIIIQILTAHEGMVVNYCPQGEIQPCPTIHQGCLRLNFTNGAIKEQSIFV